MQAKGPKVTSNQKWGERERTNSLSEPPGGANPANTLTSRLQKDERLNLCGLKSPILWYFVTAAVGR